MNSVMVETVNTTTKEKVLLERCQGFLSRVAAMQVKNLYLLVFSGLELPCDVYLLILGVNICKQTGYRL